MWVAGLLGLAWGADCTDALGAPEALSAALTRADLAIAALQPEALAVATEDVDRALACQFAPIHIETAATIHRVHGIQAFVAGDTEATNLWFAASRALEPTLPLGHDIGGPLQSAWDRAAPNSVPHRTELARPRRGALVVDGQLVQSRPTYLPWVFQHVDEGEVLDSALVLGGEPPPRYPGSPKPPPLPGEARKRGKPLTLSFVAVGAASIGTFAGAARTRALYKDPSTPDAKADRLIPTNRALGVTAYALGGAAIGLGTVALAVEW